MPESIPETRPSMPASQFVHSVGRATTEMGVALDFLELAARDETADLNVLSVEEFRDFSRVFAELSQRYKKIAVRGRITKDSPKSSDI